MKRSAAPLLASPLLAAALALTLAPSSSAHHSAAAFNTDETVTVQGKVTKYSFRNPHVYLELEVTGADGGKELMEVEAGAGSVLSPLGFTRDSVQVGDEVSIIGNPGRRNPTGLLLGKELYKADGSYHPLHIGARSTYNDQDASASSLAGTWFSPPTAFFAFLGGSSQWPLTEKGRQEMANTDPTATPQKDCIPIGAPGLMFYPVANTLSVEEDRVLMKVDWMDSERSIWLDGRAHPAADETFPQGFSVGRWEGAVLVAETRNFAPNDIGLSTTLPGSSQKKLTERFELAADGKSLLYSGTLEDPEYLSGRVEFSGAWLYRPQMSHSNESCDLEVARRFLDD